MTYDPEPIWALQGGVLYSQCLCITILQSEGGREGGRERGREGGREGEREGERERGRERGKD